MHIFGMLLMKIKFVMLYECPGKPDYKIIIEIRIVKEKNYTR